MGEYFILVWRRPWESRIMLRQIREFFIDPPSFELDPLLDPPPKPSAITICARSRMICCMGPQRNNHMRSTMPSTQITVAREGAPRFHSNTSLRVRPLLVVTKVRRVNSI